MEDAQPLDAFCEARGRPGLFLFSDIDPKTPLAVAAAVASNHFEELDIVIHSSGGSIDAAYKIVEFLRLRSNKLRACVPLWAKSAATLIAIGSDTIELGELGELGPLDVQMHTVLPEGGHEYRPALDDFQALQQLGEFATKTLWQVKSSISENVEETEDLSIQEATKFVGSMMAPLLAQVKPERLGEYGRLLTLAIRYGDRLLQRCTDWPEEQREEVLNKLVFGYPAHSYVLDVRELSELGFPAMLMSFDDPAILTSLYETANESESLIEVRGLLASKARSSETTHKQ